MAKKSFCTTSLEFCGSLGLNYRCLKIPPPINSKNRHARRDRQEIQPQLPLLCRRISSVPTVSRVSCWSAPDIQWLGFKFKFFLFPSSHFSLTQHTNTDTPLLKLGEKRKETRGMPRDWIPLTSQNLGRLPVPKTLLSGEREQGTDRVIILRDSGELMEKELLLSDRFMHLTPGLTSLSVIQMLLYRLVIF